MTEQQLETISKVNQISDPLLRDVVWLVYLPSISKGQIDEEYDINLLDEGNIDQLIQWANSIKAEKLPVPKSNLPLGKYAELLMEAYLQNHKKYQLIASNLQLIDGQLTVGELDYLFKEIFSNTFVHLELAIKYYLKVDYQGKIRFLGPSTKDYFERKVEKLTKTQSNYTFKYKHLLPGSIQKMQFYPKIMVKGALYFAFKEWEQMEEKNELIAGWWMEVEKISQLHSSKCYYCLIRSKRSWLFPFVQVDQLLTYPELIVKVKSILETTNEILIVRYSETNQPIDMGFVVREGWPN